MDDKIKQITGQKLVSIQTIGSMYNNDCVIVFDDKNNPYRMKVTEIMKFNTVFNTKA